MQLYDGRSDIDWFYEGAMTIGEMAADPRYAPLASVPCVLYDDGAGRVYSFELLEVMKAKLGVEEEDPEKAYEACVAALGTYKAPGDADEILDEIKATRELAEGARQAADAAQAQLDALAGTE